MADQLGIPLDQLVVGRTYCIGLEDCCIEGYFTDTLVAVHRDEDGDLDMVEFARAQMTIGWGYGGSWWITEDSETDPADDTRQTSRT